MTARTRVPVMAANWKMNKTAAEAVRFVETFVKEVRPPASAVETVIAPTALSIPALAASAKCLPFHLAAQNAHPKASGAFTGELALPMLAEFGVSHVIVGHSERRHVFHETDAEIAPKLPAILAAGMTPILCVGEREAERVEGRTESVIETQLRGDLAALPAADLEKVIIAYEPVWAIGTGRNATVEDAAAAIGFIRSWLAKNVDAEGAAATRILYGGSVNAQNLAAYLAIPDIDGGLVGGASLDPATFASLCCTSQESLSRL